MRTFVLRVWAESAAAAGAPGLEFVEIGEAGAREVARHEGSFPASETFAHAGKAVRFADLLLAANLADKHLLGAAGAALYAGLAQGAVGEALATVGMHDRVRLDLRSEALEALPWELMRRGGIALFMHLGHPWSLGSEAPSKLDPLVKGPVACEPPLRVLVVVGNEPDDALVQGDEELRRVEDRLHRRHTRMLFRALLRPDSDEIVATLREFRPHVFHFIGHGDVVDGVPLFRVWSASRQQTVSWDANAVRDTLSGVGAPRLVLLNACQAGRPRSTWGLARAFLDSGVRAVVAMQADIAGDAAVVFGEELYAALARGEALDVAVASGRAAVSRMADAASAASWPLPRLIARGPFGEVAPIAADEKAPRLKAADDFVHRWWQRTEAWESLCPAGGTCRRLVVVEGTSSIGKSEFLKVIGEMWSRTSSRVALYVDLGGPKTSDLGIIAARIADEARSDGLDARPLDDLARGAPDLAVQLRAALETIAGGRQLLVLIDGLEKWNEDFVDKVVIGELCYTYAEPDPTSRVRLAIALQPARGAARNWEEVGCKPVRIAPFKPNEWQRAAAQFIRLQRSKLSSDRQLDFFAKVAWPAAMLREPEEIVIARADYPPDTLALIRLVRAQAERL